MLCLEVETMKRPRVMDVVMNEPISMPGCPDLIVTRAHAWHFLRSLGYQAVGGFGSVDYMVMGGRNLQASKLPLTDDATREHMFDVMYRVEMGTERVAAGQ